MIKEQEKDLKKSVKITLEKVRKVRRKKAEIFEQLGLSESSGIDYTNDPSINEQERKRRQDTLMGWLCELEPDTYSESGNKDNISANERLKAASKRV